jgi:glycosyltransferase involved in cell wall biosynthesis
MIDFPLISVIIPAHNSAKTIGIAIESMIMQTYPDLEIIVIDDNSIDNTKEVVADFVANHDNVWYYALPYNDPHRFNRQGKNINAGWMARNYGFEKVNGDWITFQDADDASLINRIEVQYNLAIEYNSSHVCVDWQMFKEEYVSKKLDVEKLFNEKEEVIVPADYILKLVKETKGPLMNILGGAHQMIPFSLKRLRFIDKLFFKSWEPYPCAGNSPLIRREVIEKMKFRPLNARIWPSQRGRGTDRDFNFAVAEAFRDSISVKLPLYLWRVKSQNPEYLGYELEKCLREG